VADLSNNIEASVYRPDDDQHLVSLCKRGDVDAFEVLVRRYEKKMFNIAFRMLGSHEDAVEVVQDTFVAAFRHITGYKEKAAFSTWLTSIVLNQSRNRIKQVKVRQRHEQRVPENPVAGEDEPVGFDPPAEGLTPLEQLEQHDLRGAVQGCLAAMDTEFREVLILRDMQGCSYHEIADILGVAEGTVKSRLFRARTAARDSLKGLVEDLTDGL